MTNDVTAVYIIIDVERLRMPMQKIKGLKDFFESGSKAGIRSDHASKLSRQLVRLDIAKVPADMNLLGWRLHSFRRSRCNLG
jgi:proteic killer suppression protein